MKITIVQGAFLPVPPSLGGAVEKMWFALGKEFAKQGHQVTHISRQYHKFPTEEVIGGVVHKRVKGYSSPSSGLYLKWLDLLYTLKAKSKIPPDTDVIVTNTFWTPIVVSSELKQRCFVDVQRMPKGQFRWYKKAGRLRANSSVVADAIKQEILKNNYEKVVMVPNPLPFEIRDTINFNEKKKIVLYAGRIHPEKGLKLLINAFKKVRKSWVLKIVGPHDVAAGGGGEAYNRSLKKMAAGLPIEFIGPIYEADGLNSYYRKATIFVYPSVAEQGETFGLAPLEAMAWGCVPVVSNLDCFKDFITHGSNGLIFDHRADDAVRVLSDTISKLTENNAFTAALASKATEVRQSHSIAMIGSDFLSAFTKMISPLK